MNPILDIKEQRRQLELANKRLRNTNSKSYATIRAANEEHDRIVSLERDTIALNEAQIQKNQQEYERLGTELSKLQKS